MEVTLVKIYIETDDDDLDVEMFRVHKIEEILMEPTVGHKIIMPNGESFFINKLEQNLQKKKVFLYEINEVSHYKFWGDRKSFLNKYLSPLLKKRWAYSEKQCQKRFLIDAKKSQWRSTKFDLENEN